MVASAVRRNCKKLFAGNLGASNSGLSEADLQRVFKDHNCIHVKLCRSLDGSGTFELATPPLMPC